MFKKNKRFQSFREEKEDFYGEIRSLQKLVRELKKEVSRLRKYEEYCMQNNDFVKAKKEKRQIKKNRRILEQELLNEKPITEDLIKCDKCNTFNAEILDILGKKYLFCKECNYRKKIT